MYEVEAQYTIKVKIGNTGGVYVREDSVIVDSNNKERQVTEIYRDDRNGKYYLKFEDTEEISAKELAKNLNNKGWWVKK